MAKLDARLGDNAFVLVLLPIILIPAILFDTTFAMVQVWMVNETFVHGFLVFPLVIWLIWQKKNQILMHDLCPEPWAFSVLVLLLLGWLVSSVVDVEIVQQFCMITIIITTVWIAVGRRILLYIFLPIVFLYFAVPFGQELIPPLMQYTAGFTVGLIKMMGIPVYQDGFLFTLTTGSWSIVEECSGVRYLIASFSLGSIYAYINYSSTKKRVIFILLSIIVPVVGNGLRAFGIVMIGHFSGMKLAVGADHLLYGWVFFGVIIFLLFYAGSFWWDSDESMAGIDDTSHQEKSGCKSHSPEFTLLALSLIFVTMVFSVYAQSGIQENVRPVDIQLPKNLSGWLFEGGRSLDWRPVVVNPDEEIYRGYNSEKGFVQLDIAYYITQRQGAEAVSSSNKVIDSYGGDWKLVSSVEIVEGDRKYIESELIKTDTRLLVWRWYRVGRHEVSNPYKAKALEVYSLIVEGRSDAAVVSIATQLNETKEAARHKLRDFREALSDDLHDVLEAVQDER